MEIGRDFRVLEVNAGLTSNLSLRLDPEIQRVLVSNSNWLPMRQGGDARKEGFPVQQLGS